MRSGVRAADSARPIVAALVLMLVFGAFANAAGMIGPVVAFQDRLRNQLGGLPPLVTTSGFYLLAIVVCPLAITALQPS